MAKHQSAANPTQTKEQQEEKTKTTSAAFKSSGFATFSAGSNPFKSALAKGASNGFGFGSTSTTTATATATATNNTEKKEEKEKSGASAFGTSGFASFTKGNPFATALASTGNRSGSGFGFTNPPPPSASSTSETPETNTNTNDANPNTSSDPPSAASTSAPPPPTSSSSPTPDAATTTNSSNPPPPPASSSAPPSPTVAGPPPSNGEESEQCVLQLRIKTFRLTTARDLEKAPPTETSQSVPKKVGEWKEMGIGPIRVLQPPSSSSTTHVRLVQRRETTPGGQGTKVLLNCTISTCELDSSLFEAPSNSTSPNSGKIFKPEGKFCRVGAPVQDGDEVVFETYLLKFKSEGDREIFTNVVADSCGYTKL
ncbi:hypothetical protein TrST_g8452 [Triparma strigata]|uniref:RanBD1 domain-containing protein n=1 Tax=Triparma strigata TaxID=1606541 RepID=A0A9W7C0W2_9STRA|nr:hypothetical protein TrST_g8452 [Triparma strigata]